MTNTGIAQARHGMVQSKTPPRNALRTYDAAGQAGSFTCSAKMRRVTQFVGN
jgi:hypothetical protein